VQDGDVTRVELSFRQHGHDALSRAGMGGRPAQCEGDVRHVVTPARERRGYFKQEKKEKYDARRKGGRTGLITMEIKLLRHEVQTTLQMQLLTHEMQTALQKFTYEISPRFLLCNGEFLWTSQLQTMSVFNAGKTL